jgi:hypothetical protein
MEFNSTGVSGFLPNEFKAFFLDSYGVEKRVGEHLRFNRNTAAHPYLIQTLQLAKHLRHKVCIAIPPVRSDYKKATGEDSAVLFKSLVEIVDDFSSEYPVDLINGFDSGEFSDSDFGDFDHLLPLGRGTEVLSKLICNSFSRK